MPTLFRKKPRHASINSSLNSSARLPTRSSSQCFQRCRATMTLRPTHNELLIAGGSARKLNEMVSYFLCLSPIESCQSKLVMDWKARSQMSSLTTFAPIKLRLAFVMETTKADSQPGSMESRKRSEASTRVREGQSPSKEETGALRVSSGSSSSSSF